MDKNYDLIVIGTGVAGSTAAYKCAEAGWKVAIIDHNPFGGTCALRGCDPKKVLVGAADLVDHLNRMENLGVAADAKINWKQLMKFKRSFTNPVPENKEKGFNKAGIDTFHGTAKFLNENTIVIIHSSGKVGDDSLTGKYILIANGARPAKLNITGEEYLTYSDQFLELDKLPEEIIFIGGGYISFEFAHIAARAGAKVTILHRGKHPLEGFDKDLVGLLVKETEEIGIKINLNSEVKSIERITAANGNDRLKVNGKKNGKDIFFESVIAVHGAGRTPELDEMKLENGNVKREKRGVAVNEFLQSVTNPVVYSAGDSAASMGLPLTPVATMEANIASSNMLKGNHKKQDYTVIPTVVFTIPHLSSVGLNEDEAVKKGLKFKVNFKETSGWYSSKRINENYSAFKVLVEEGSGKILGAHLLGHHSDELINLFAIAIKFNIKADDLKSMIYSYPTRSSDIGSMV